MIDRYGAVEAARRLVVSGDVQTGFERLVRAGRPELTIECAVVDPHWEPLFGPQHREAALWRLRQAGMARISASRSRTWAPSASIRSLRNVYDPNICRSAI
jgi:hypothetical protein